MSRTITWYVVREVMVPFFLGLFVFTFVVMMFQILKLVDLVVAYGAKVTDVLQLLLYLMLNLTVFTVPMAFLLAVLLAFNRLSADSEIVAMKAGGVGLQHHLLPVLLFGAAVTAASCYVTWQAAPEGLYKLEMLKLNLFKSGVLAELEERVFRTDLDDVVIYTNKIDPLNERMEQVFIYDGRESRPMIYVAEWGVLVPRPEQDALSIRLHKGSIHSHGDNPDEYEIIKFEVMDINVKADALLGGGDFTKEYLHMGQIELAGDLVRRQKEIAELKPGGFGTQEDYVLRKEYLEYRYRRAHTEFHRRFAFPFTCIVFAVIGIPMGIAPVRSGRSRGFTIGLLALCIYYVLFRVGENVSWQNWHVHPAITMWLPNVIFLAAGIYLFWARSTEREIKFLTRLGSISDAIAARMSKAIYRTERPPDDDEGAGS